MSPILDGEQITVCPACSTAHHGECWDENRGCCVKSCPQASRALDIDLPREGSDKLVLTRDAVASARPHAPERVSNPCMRCGKQVPEGELYCRVCAPGPAESQDTRNVGPIIAMLFVLGVVLAWLVVMSIPSSTPPVNIKAPGVTNNVKP